MARAEVVVRELVEEVERLAGDGPGGSRIALLQRKLKRLKVKLRLEARMKKARAAKIVKRKAKRRVVHLHLGLEEVEEGQGAGASVLEDEAGPGVREGGDGRGRKAIVR